MIHLHLPDGHWNTTDMVCEEGLDETAQNVKSIT